MGFNVIRWLSDPQYRAVKRWKRDKGDATRKLDFPLTASSVVFDVGSYIGDYAVDMVRRHGCRVEAFEPVPAYAQRTEAAVAGLAGVRVHRFGLSNRDHVETMTLDGLASSTYRAEGERIEAVFRDVDAVIAELGLEQIDVVKLNVEGGEYDILPRLIERGHIGRCRFLLVQFHLIRPDDRARYEALSVDLARTHRLVWRYPFIWEMWALRER